VADLRTEARFPSVEEKAGHYESFYIKATDPNGGLGAWIRHTVHKRPKEKPKASLWFTLFDRDAAGPKATKATFGSDRLRVPPSAYIRIDSSELAPGRANGSIRTDALEAFWDLTFEDHHDPYYHLPRPWMYNAALPKTKFLSPYPNAVFDGRLKVGERDIDVSEWRGMIGHNWGAEHAERWVWIQGAAFEGHPAGDYFDMAVGRIKVAGLRTPWVGNARLVLDGEEHRLGGFERVPSTKVEEEPTRCRFDLRGKGVKVRGEVSAERKDFVAWIYADPVGPEHNTLNCSISDLRLEVERDGAPAIPLRVSSAAAYELGTRDTDHGIPVQPYGDG
jgi:hypothetical protein